MLHPYGQTRASPPLPPPVQIFSNLLGVIPVLATAFTCQMTVNYVMDDMKTSFSQPRMTFVSVRARQRRGRAMSPGKGEGPSPRHAGRAVLAGFGR